MKVAKVIDCYTVAINAGEADGIENGAILEILSDPVIDPEDGAILGLHAKLRVKVTEVFERYCIAETYKLTVPTFWELLTGTIPRDQLVSVNVGDEARIVRTT